jgi:hypothetical protein
MFIILSWFGIVFNLTEFALRGILMNTMQSDIYCTASSIDRSKLPKHSVFDDTSQEVSSSIYILALRHLFQIVRERMSTSCLNSCSVGTGGHVRYICIYVGHSKKLAKCKIDN